MTTVAIQTDPAQFAKDRFGPRTEITIGVHTVAVIEAMADDRARYYGMLPGLSLRVCGSVESARHLVLFDLASWFEACGPQAAPLAEALNEQAHREREALIAQPSLDRGGSRHGVVRRVG